MKSLLRSAPAYWQASLKSSPYFFNVRKDMRKTFRLQGDSCNPAQYPVAALVIPSCRNEPAALSHLDLLHLDRSPDKGQTLQRTREMSERLVMEYIAVIERTTSLK
jgi:hypothetical protein